MRTMLKSLLLRLCLLLALALPCVCRAARTPIIPLSLPLTSDAFARFYVENPDRYEFFLRPEYAERAVHFTARDASVPVQADWFDAVSAEWRYYEAGRFSLDGYVYAVIIYNFPGEFDDPCLRVQLNGYDNQGVLRDALALDTRYSFEDVEGCATYAIDGNTVSIQSYVGYSWDADNLEAGTVDKPVFQLIREKEYRIAGGRFTLLSEKKHPVSFIRRSRAGAAEGPAPPARRQIASAFALSR